MGGSDEEVMVVGSEEEDGVVTLDESSIASLLAGAGVTITRTPAGNSSSTPRTKPATTTRVGIQNRSKTTTQTGRPAHLAPSDPLSQQKPRPAQRQLLMTEKNAEEVDPLDLGDDGMEIEFGKMDNIREMLAKSSVAITFKPEGQRLETGGKPDRVVEKKPNKEMTRSLSTPKLPSRMGPRALNGSPQLQRSLSGVRSSPKLALNPSSAKTVMKPSSAKLHTPKVKAKTFVKNVTPKRPDAPKPVPRVPKIIDRGPIDCCDSLIVETDMGFPCNFCEVSRNFSTRREMIGHLQKEHPEELTAEQSNPDLTGLFPCRSCGTVFHSKFIQRTHQKAHMKAKLGTCDKYFRYYLSFGQIKT